MEKDNRKAKTEERLKSAIVSLLKEKSFSEISTSEIVKRAGISRSGFYTHYQDKFNMIENYQNVLFNTIQYIFERNNNDLHEILIEVYQFIDQNEVYAALLSENGSKEIHLFLLTKLRVLFDEVFIPAHLTNKSTTKLHEVYASTYYSNAIFGLTQAWIRRNKKESPQELAELISSLIS